MADHQIIVDERGQPLKGWHCTKCDTKIPDDVMAKYPNTLSMTLKNAMCHKCKKMKVIKFWDQA